MPKYLTFSSTAEKNPICYSFETKPFSLIHCAIYCDQIKALASDSRLMKITATEFAVSEVKGLKLQSARQYFVLDIIVCFEIVTLPRMFTKTYDIVENIILMKVLIGIF